MLPSSDPTKTRPPTMAAEDLTGPPVLNDQSRLSLAARVLLATPLSDGAPRYMGQSAAAPTKGSVNNKPVQRARIIPGDRAKFTATLNRRFGLGKPASAPSKTAPGKDVSELPCPAQFWMALM